MMSVKMGRGAIAKFELWYMTRFWVGILDARFGNEMINIISKSLGNTHLPLRIII
jgi:hypothetical protein